MYKKTQRIFFRLLMVLSATAVIIGCTPTTIDELPHSGDSLSPVINSADNKAANTISVTSWEDHPGINSVALELNPTSNQDSKVLAAEANTADRSEFVYEEETYQKDNCDNICDQPLTIKEINELFYPLESFYQEVQTDFDLQVDFLDHQFDNGDFISINCKEGTHDLKVSGLIRFDDPDGRLVHGVPSTGEFDLTITIKDGPTGQQIGQITETQAPFNPTSGPYAGPPHPFEIIVPITPITTQNDIKISAEVDSRPPAPPGDVLEGNGPNSPEEMNNKRDAKVTIKIEDLCSDLEALGIEIKTCESHPLEVAGGEILATAYFRNKTGTVPKGFRVILGVNNGTYKEDILAGYKTGDPKIELSGTFSVFKGQLNKAFISPPTFILAFVDSQFNVDEYNEGNNSQYLYIGHVPLCGKTPPEGFTICTRINFEMGKDKTRGDSFFYIYEVVKGDRVNDNLIDSTPLEDGSLGHKDWVKPKISQENAYLSVWVQPVNSGTWYEMVILNKSEGGPPGIPPEKEGTYFYWDFGGDPDKCHAIEVEYPDNFP